MFGIDKDTLQEIQQTAVAAEGAKGKAVIVELPNEPAYVYGLVSNGEFKRVTAEPQPRHVGLGSVDQVIPYSVLASGEMGGKPGIYFDERQVVCIVDDSLPSHRSDRATVMLLHTPEFALIGTLDNETYTQKEFVSLLRVDLADCRTPTISQLIAASKAIDFSSQTSGHKHVEHGRESIGLDIKNEVRSKAGDIPEEVELEVRIFQDRALSQRHTIRCQVEVDARGGMFRLTPLPADLRQAMDRDMQYLETMLQAASCPVIYGQP